MIYAFLIIACLGFAWLAWKNIEKAALVLVAILPLYILRFTIVVPTTLLELFILILFVIFLIKNRLLYKERFKALFKNKLQPQARYPFDWELILWLAIALVAVGVAGFAWPSFGIWRAYFFEPALCFILFVNIFNSKEKIVKAIAALAVAAVAISVISVIQYATGQFIPNEFWAEADQRRATSIYPFPNAVGLYLAPLVFLFVGLLFYGYKKSKGLTIFLCMAIAGSLLAIGFARSEGALFAIAIASLIGLLAATKKTRIAAVLIIVIGAAAMIFSPSISNYVTKRATLHNFSGEIRRLQWRETMKMLKDGRMITGAGLNNYQKSVAPYHQEGMFINKENLPHDEFLKKVWNDEKYRATHWQPLEIYMYPHNIALNFWTELGILGLLLFIWIIVKYYVVGINVYRTLRRNRDHFAWILLGLLLAMLAIIIHGLVDVPYFKNDLAILFWLLLSFVGVSRLLMYEK